MWISIIIFYVGSYVMLRAAIIIDQKNGGSDYSSLREKTSEQFQMFLAWLVPGFNFLFGFMALAVQIYQHGKEMRQMQYIRQLLHKFFFGGES